MKYIKHLRLIVCVFVLATGIFAAPGDLDTTFGSVGFKTTSITNGLDHARGIVRQPDGKIILAGNRNEDSGSAITLIRYNPDGSLDTTFDGDGIVLGDTGRANAVALQTDGKIVVTGRIGNLQGNFFAVLRYNSDGTPDATFANNGVFIISDLITGSAVAVQPDGKIVAAGTLITPGSDDFAAVRLNPDGTLDTSFDGDGKVSTAVGDPSVNSGDDVVKTIALQTDGKIIVGGFSPFVNTARDFSLVRYNPDGSLDASFDGDGILHTSFNNSMQDEFLQSIALDASGRIVAAGYAVTGVGEESFALARYNPDGSLDASFDGDGKLVIKTRENTVEEANDLVLQPDGKILVAGFSGRNAQDFTLVRFDPDGTLDPSFGTGGAVYTRVSEEFDAVFTSVTLAPNGDIFAGGYAQNSPGADSFAFARYDSHGLPFPDFGVFGYVTNDFQIAANTSYEARSVALQPDGKFLAAGNYLTNTDATNGILARYDINGSLDRNFNNQAGFIVINSPTANSRELTAVAVQADGKILALGNYEGDTDAGIFVSRFNENGTNDTQFGNNGQVLISVLSGGGIGQDIKVLPDGKIVIAGATLNIFTQLVKFAVFKLNTDGSRDSGFGSNGIASTSFSSSNDVALSLSIQTDGKIVATGASNFNEGGNSQVALARFNTSGSLDSAFGTGGKVTGEVGAFLDLAADSQIQTDGRIVVGGVSCTDAGCNGGNGFIFRYNQNGTPDASFDGDGRVFVQPKMSGSPSAISSIAIQPDGKIVGGGAALNQTTQSDVLIGRYNADGSPDTGFGTNGIVSSDINNQDQFAYSIALQPDGKILAVGSSNEGTHTEFAVWRYLGSSTTFVPLGAAPFDFDGDRKTDISIFRPGPGEWWYLRSVDLGNRAFQFGSSTDKLAPADFTGDGKVDVAFWRESTGEWFVLRSEDSSFYSFPFGTVGDIPVPADYDGDGKADPAIFRPSSATWFIIRSTDGGTTIAQFGAGTDLPVPADYDGDGKADLAIFRPSDGSWWLNRSNSGLIIYNFGTGTDRTVPGDYTGDGKADVAFWRPTTGEWFILRSEDASFYSFPFGAVGDMPAPGDYDGDGRVDPTVFRPGNNTWYKLQTTGGFEAVTFGINGDVPVPGAFVR
ncbi:MAG: hypothetical protein R2747_15465 [Pyrinomonadaceae bacterium]